jgi:hypothetical protein
MWRVIQSLFWIVVVISILGYLTEPKKSNEQLQRENIQRIKNSRIGDAEFACRYAFQNAAHDPDSIEWLRHERTFRYEDSDEVIAISRQPLRAKNALGGRVKSAVNCRLARFGDDWRVTKLFVDR